MQATSDSEPVLWRMESAVEGRERVLHEGGRRKLRGADKKGAVCEGEVRGGTWGDMAALAFASSVDELDYPSGFALRKLGP